MSEGTPPRVLVVDDEPAIRTLVARMLRRAGFEPVEATDGQEAIEQLDRSPFDAVVLDLMMPDVGGERMLAQLRSAPETKRTPVVIITGKPEVAPEVIGLVGRENFFPKPFDPEAVIGRINSILQ